MRSPATDPSGASGGDSYALAVRHAEERDGRRILFRALDAEFGGFTLDPCCTVATALCPTFYTREDDGLAKPWAGHIVYMNPPFGRAISRWVEKAATEAAAGALVVGLLPARTDTAWWHRWVTRWEVRFLPGRLRFGGARHAAPFPSVLVIWRSVADGARLAPGAGARYGRGGGSPGMAAACGVPNPREALMRFARLTALAILALTLLAAPALGLTIPPAVLARADEVIQ